MKVLLEKLYEDRIEWKYGEAEFGPLKKKAIAKRQYLPILLFGLLPKLNPELQKQTLQFLIDCVNVELTECFHPRNASTTWRSFSRWIFCANSSSCSCRSTNTMSSMHRSPRRSLTSTLRCWSIHLHSLSDQKTRFKSFSTSSPFWPRMLFLLLPLSVERSSTGPENDAASVPSRNVRFRGR